MVNFILEFFKMAKFSLSSTMAILVIVGVLQNLLFHKVGAKIGVCYGRNGNDLPPVADVIKLYKSSNIENIRLFDPVPEVLNALKGSNLGVILGVPNPSLKALTDPKAATEWVLTNVVKFYPSVNFKYIAVGNEVSPGFDLTAQFAAFLFPAMQNVKDAVVAAGLKDKIKVSTVMYAGVLANTYPPSASVFRPDLRDFTEPILQLLIQNDLPLLANVYPYFAYIGDPKNVPLDYALFKQTEPTSLGYQNLFDAMLDSYHYALEKDEKGSMKVVVAESGWPSAGGLGATMENAKTYYTNLNNYVKKEAGTPYKPGVPVETYMFAMFDENLKLGADSEKHFGLFYPNKISKYNVQFAI